MQLGATTFEPGDFLNILSAIEHLERMATQLRSVSRLMRDADELISVQDRYNTAKA